MLLLLYAAVLFLITNSMTIDLPSEFIDAENSQTPYQLHETSRFIVSSSSTNQARIAPIDAMDDCWAVSLEFLGKEADFRNHDEPPTPVSVGPSEQWVFF